MEIYRMGKIVSLTYELLSRSLEKFSGIARHILQEVSSAIYIFWLIIILLFIFVPTRYRTVLYISSFSSDCYELLHTLFYPRIVIFRF